MRRSSQSHFGFILKVYFYKSRKACLSEESYKDILVMNLAEHSVKYYTKHSFA